MLFHSRVAVSQRDGRKPPRSLRRQEQPATDAVAAIDGKFHVRRSVAKNDGVSAEMARLEVGRPWRQIADWRRAISFLESLPEWPPA
jgi:hypothetical protein